METVFRLRDLRDVRVLIVPCGMETKSISPFGAGVPVY